MWGVLRWFPGFGWFALWDCVAGRFSVFVALVWCGWVGFGDSGLVCVFEVCASVLRRLWGVLSWFSWFWGLRVWGFGGLILRVYGW